MNEAEKERARKKERLRQGMTETPKRDEDDVKLRRHRAWKVFLLLVFLGLAAGGFYLLHTYRRAQVYETAEVLWEKELSSTGGDLYAACGEFVLRYNRDGASYINGSGDIVWTQSYEMSDPIAAVRGSYAVIADRGGTQIYICNDGGRTGTVSTLLPVRKVTVSAEGVTAAVLEGEQEDRVYFYDMTGRQMGIEIRSPLSTDGYTMDLSLSPDGKQLAAAYLYLDQGVMKNQVVFRNFGEEGQEKANRLVGAFLEYGDRIVGRVAFLSDVYACAFAQDRICFYSLRNRISPQMARQIDLNEEISGVFYSGEYVGMARGEDGRNEKQVSIFDGSGNQVTEFTVDFAYTGAGFSGGCIVFYNTSRCAVYNLHGERKFEGNLGSGIVWMSCLSEHELLMIDGDTVRAVTLK